jgi:hypothetical protein
MESPDNVAKAGAERLAGKAAAAIEVTRNSLRVVIDAHFCSQAARRPFVAGVLHVGKHALTC